MVTYMSSFIPKLADHTAPLRDLMKGNVDFAITFESLTATSLAYYHRKEPVVNDPTFALNWQESPLTVI